MKQIIPFSFTAAILLTLTAPARAEGYCYINREWAPKRAGIKTQYVAYHGAYALLHFSPAAYSSDADARKAAQAFIRQREAAGACLSFMGLQYDVLQKN